MLSRVAENLFWMARYIERADGLARLMDQACQMDLEADQDDLSGFGPGGPGPLETILDILAFGEERLARPFARSVEAAAEMLDFLAFRAEGGQSIRSMISLARENARSTQESLSAEVWNQVNRLHLNLSSRKSEVRFLASPARFLDWVKRSCILIAGLVNDTLPRDEPYHFLQLGFFSGEDRHDNPHPLQRWQPCHAGGYRFIDRPEGGTRGSQVDRPAQVCWCTGRLFASLWRPGEFRRDLAFPGT